MRHHNSQVLKVYVRYWWRLRFRYIVCLPFLRIKSLWCYYHIGTPSDDFIFHFIFILIPTMSHCVSVAVKWNMLNAIQMWTNRPGNRTGEKKEEKKTTQNLNWSNNQCFAEFHIRYCCCFFDRCMIDGNCYHTEYKQQVIHNNKDEAIAKLACMLRYRYGDKSSPKMYSSLNRCALISIIIFIEVDDMRVLRASNTNNKIYAQLNHW